MSPDFFSDIMITSLGIVLFGAACTLIGMSMENQRLVKVARRHGWVTIWPDGMQEVPSPSKKASRDIVLRPERIPPHQRN